MMSKTADLANSLPFTVRTLADIEHGVRKASPGAYAMLENKLAWALIYRDVFVQVGASLNPLNWGCGDRADHLRDGRVSRVH